MRELIELKSFLTEPELAGIDRLIGEGAEKWLPRPGPQTDAYQSEADFLFFGGAAGGGKTDLLIGLALNAHRHSAIFRRQYRQLQAIVERTAEILGTRGGYNDQKKIWRLADGRRLHFGACQNPGDEQGFQGQPHDLKAFDEIGHFLEAQFRFLLGWNRTTNPDQRCRVVCAGNPPTSPEGEWVIKFWAPWLDPEYPNPALPGELRWFATIGDAETEVEGRHPFEHKGEWIGPKSRTFIPSAIDDNPFLLATGYKATLQALPEPLRSRMLNGDFGVGREDNPWQVIPSPWVAAAQARWQDAAKPRGVKMDALGVDVARGGGDATVLGARFGNWFAELQVYPGGTTPDGPSVAALAVAALRDGAPVLIDVIGVGASVYDHLKDNGVNAVAMNAAEASSGRDRSGTLAFSNKRAQWWWAMREALDPDYGSVIALPPERALKADLCAPRWRLTGRGIQIESKEDIVKRLGRSPDRGDAVVMALQDSRRDARRRRRPASVLGAYDPLARSR